MSGSFGTLVGLIGMVAVASVGVVLPGPGPVVSIHAATMAAQSSAEEPYLDKCAICHGRDGAGKTAQGRKLKVQDVRESIKTVSEEEMIAIVEKGKAPNMDAFSKDFSSDEIKALVEYYRGLAK